MEDKMQKRIREQHLGIKGTNRLILTEMLIEANKDRCVSISRSELAKRANCSKRAVQKAYRLFQEHGLVLLEQKGTGRTTYIWRFIEVLNCERCGGVSAVSPGWLPWGEQTGPPGESQRSPNNEGSGEDIPRDTPDDDPDGLFTPTTLVRTHVREAPEDIFLDLFLELATSFLGKSQCVYWGKNLAEELGVSAREGWQAWKQLCSAGRLVKVVNCQLHNGERTCYRPPRSEPVAGQDEQSAYSPVFGVNFSMSAAETLAEEKARQERERAEAKKRPPINLPVENMVWLSALVNSLTEQPDDREVTGGG